MHIYLLLWPFCGPFWGLNPDQNLRPSCPQLLGPFQLHFQCAAASKWRSYCRKSAFSTNSLNRYTSTCFCGPFWGLNPDQNLRPSCPQLPPTTRPYYSKQMAIILQKMIFSLNSLNYAVYTGGHSHSSNALNGHL